jgi:two-component sensor histidine kinase
LMSVSLIVAELVTNSLKHAFNGRKDGEISISIALDGGTYAVTVADDGPGIPGNVASTKSGRLGRGILDSLARQLGGQIFYERGSGARVRLIFLA